jgi:Phage integrase family
LRADVGQSAALDIGAVALDMIVAEACDSGCSPGNEDTYSISYSGRMGKEEGAEGASNGKAGLLLTGCRKSEILSLRWEHVDFERHCLRLRDSKTGAKVVPVAAAALEILAGLPRANEWVLAAAASEGHYTGLQKAWEKVRTRAELPGLRLHDLRHSFASFAIADGATLYMVGKVFGHKQARTTEGYAHLADDPLRATADRTANRINNAMKGIAAGAGVVPLPARKA